MHCVLFFRDPKVGMKIENIIGDYQGFFSDLLQRQKQVGICINGMLMSHLLYRTAVYSEYEALRDQLKLFCKSFVETQFNGRAVSVLWLRDPLLLDSGFEVSVIELPAPRPAHRYPSGLESTGVVVGDALPEFNKKYSDVLTGVKDHGTFCQPSFITFDNDKTSKFYHVPLAEIVLKQGWQFEDLVIDND